MQLSNGKTIAIYQPYFFPYLGYWQLLDAADVFVIGDEFQYMTKGFINRNTLLLNHAPHRFTISLEGASPRRRISEIQVGDDFRKFRQTLAHAYGKSPYYLESMGVMDPILDHQDRNLARFLGHQISEIARHLELRAEIVFMSDLGLDRAPRSREQRLYDCVKSLGGDRIVNPIGSRSLYSSADFKAQGIALGLLRPHEVAYPQASRVFVPNLSLIDAMMCNPRQELVSLTKRYDIVNAEGAVAWTTR